MKTKTKILLFAIIMFAALCLPNKVFAGTYGNLTFDVYGENGTIRITDCDENATSAVIPSAIDGIRVTVIADHAFYDCKNLTSVTIPATVKEIQFNAFRDCEKLKSVVLPNGIDCVMDGLFAGCTSLTNVTIPSSVVKLENASFAGCTSLTSIKLPNSITEMDPGVFEGCTRLNNVTVPSKVTEISQSTFKDCTSLTNISLPNGVTEIGTSAFENCANLKTLKMPTSLRNVGWEAFQYCSKLETITFPESIKGIDSSAFKECKSLKTVTIPTASDDVYIANDAFYNANPNLILYVVKNSAAHKYALNNDIKYKYYTIAFSKCSVSGIANKTYTGKAIKQSGLVVKYGGVKLKDKTDYSVSYSNNVNTGKATVKITGKGKYSGTIIKTFYILPKKPTGLKVSSQTTSKITIKWSKVTGASGYSIYKWNPKKKTYEYLARTTNKSYTIKKLKAGETYLFKVRAYKTVSGSRHYGSYSTQVKTATKPSTTKITSLTTKSKKATLKWKKISGVSGYQIYMSTSKNGKYSKIKTITKSGTVKYTKSSLKKGKRYYFKVRSYKTVNGKRIYSSYSTVKSIKVK